MKTEQKKAEDFLVPIHHFMTLSVGINPLSSKYEQDEKITVEVSRKSERLYRLLEKRMKEGYSYVFLLYIALDDRFGSQEFFKKREAFVNKIREEVQAGVLLYLYKGEISQIDIEKPDTYIYDL